MQCLPVCSVADLEKPNKCGGEVHHRVTKVTMLSVYKIGSIRSSAYNLQSGSASRAATCCKSSTSTPREILDGVLQLCLAEPRDSVKG